MMDLLAFITAATVPIVIGWLALILLERHEPVLAPAERWFWAVVLGPTFLMLVVFVCHAVQITKLNLFGFLVPSILLLAVLLGLAWKTGALSIRTYSPPLAPSRSLSTLKIGMVALFTLWTAVKIFAGAYDLVTVPTYWDDTFNNWNMRGKMYFVTEKLQFTIPVGNGAIQTEGGVGSYPPSLPMLKTWVSVLRTEWREPLVNGLHLLWITGLTGCFYFGLRRKLSPLLSLAGACLLLSLPLLLIHAFNPYADIFVASHVLVAALGVYFLAQSKTENEARTWLKLFGFALGLLIFTKNESSVMYGPVLAVLAVWSLMRLSKAGILPRDGMRKMIALGLLLIAVLAVPWLAFKWLHGLTFGNAKSVSGMRIAFEPRVVQAIWFHLSHEANWMFLPLVLPLTVIAAGRRAWQSAEGVFTVFVFGCLAAQFFIFAFTPLATEAIMQTGLSRGILHVAPVGMLLLILLIDRLLERD